MGDSVDYWSTVDSVKIRQKLGIYCLHDDVEIPSLATEKSACFDLKAYLKEGETIIGSDIKDRYFTSLLNVKSGDTKKELTMKEIEIVKLISKGFTSKEIAEKLFISHRTVETHRHNILKKLDMPNAAQLSSWAKEKGYV